MQDTGIIRHIDNLGRVTLPIELRRALDIDVRDPVQIYTDGQHILLKKAQLGDVFTGGNAGGLIEYEGKLVSRESVKRLVELAGYHLAEDDEDEKPIRKARKSTKK